MPLHLSASALRAICFIAILLIVARLRSRGRLRFRFTGVAVGNALQILHIYVDPRVRYVIAQRLDEQAEDDGEDDCADPAKDLERQLRRIRRGKPPDRLTIRLREKR